jgi:hypothetical protein
MIEWGTLSCGEGVASRSHSMDCGRTPAVVTPFHRDVKRENTVLDGVTHNNSPGCRVISVSNRLCTDVGTNFQPTCVFFERICGPAEFGCTCVSRDVKPENIVLEGGRWGGRLYLLDFGGVQAAASATSSALGSTVVGTYGYMVCRGVPTWITLPLSVFVCMAVPFLVTCVCLDAHVRELPTTHAWFCGTPSLGSQQVVICIPLGGSLALHNGDGWAIWYLVMCC